MRHDTFCAIQQPFSLCLPLAWPDFEAEIKTEITMEEREGKSVVGSSIEMIFGCMEAVWLAARQEAY